MSPMPGSSISSAGLVFSAMLGGILLIGTPYVLRSPDSASPPVSDTINSLTEPERETGWRLLFDGTSLDGWRGYQRDSVPGGWAVEASAIHFEGEGSNSTTLITTDTFDHFELRIEWKISPEGNSGIIYRATEDKKDPYRTGPEFQVLDNAVLDNPSGSVYQAGALYGLYAPTKDVTRPVGEYNEARIVVRGNHVEHWMNGTKLLEAEIGSEAWKERVAGTKFTNYDAFVEAETGHIALQDHGHPVWYRDIKLRPLSPSS